MAVAGPLAAGTEAVTTAGSPRSRRGERRRAAPSRPHLAHCLIGRHRTVTRGVAAGSRPAAPRNGVTRSGNCGATPVESGRTMCGVIITTSSV